MSNTDPTKKTGVNVIFSNDSIIFLFNDGCANYINKETNGRMFIPFMSFLSQNFTVEFPWNT